MKKHVQIFALGAAVALGCISAGAQELPGLVSWWQGENNLLDSKGTNNLTVYVPPPPPTPVPYVPGKIGQAFSFNGGIVNIPDSPSLQPTNFTIQAWVKGTNIITYRYILCKSRAGGGISWALYSGDSATAHFFVGVGGTFYNSGPAGAGVWDGNWHQLTGVYDGSAVHIYVDGVEKSSGAASGDINYSSAAPLVFGDYSVSRGFAYPGALDEVKLIDRALTAEEVLASYNSPSGPTSGLVSWWKAEGNALDSVGTNNGTDGNSEPPPPRIFTYGDGKNGNAFFAKNGIGTAADAAELRPANISVEAWVKSVAPGTFRYVATKTRGTNLVSYALYTEDAGGINFFINLEGNGTVKSPVLTGDKIWDGAWHLAAGTYDGSYVRLYVDGIEVGSGTEVTNDVKTIDYTYPTELVVGDYRLAGGLPFWGQVDDLQVYNRALTAAEIRQQFTQGKLVSWWQAGMNANDSIGSNNGTLSGTASYGMGRTALGAFSIGTAGSVQVPDAASLRPNNITVEALVSALAPGANKYVISKSNTGTDASYAFFTGPSGGLVFYVTTASGRVSSAAAPASIWDGNYHAVAGVYDGSKVRLYVDGAEVGAGTTASGNIAYGSYQSGKLLFGDFSETPGSADFNGKIDDVRIYNAALTAKDVANDAFLPVLIVDQPVSQTITPGATTTLNVVARGEQPLRYQWVKDGTDVTGATNATLVLSNAQAGSYSVRVSPGTVSYAPGKYGLAYDAAAGGLARVPNSPVFYTNTSFSVQLWAKGTNMGTYKWLVSKSRHPTFHSASWGLHTAQTAGVRWLVVLDGTTLSSIEANISPTTGVWDGNWHQITGTWDGNLAVIYLDGNQIQIGDSIGGGDITYTTNYLNGDVLIGDVNYPVGDYHFPGAIDEVKFWGRALSASEVAETFTNPTGPAASNGLVDWWKMENNLADSADHNDGYPLPPAGTVISQTAVLSVQATAPVLSNAKVSGANFQANVTGASGSSYVVWRSSDLKTWTRFLTNTAPFTISDPIATGAKFYRVSTQ